MASSGWQLYAFGSAVFAGLTAILAKAGVSQINSNLAMFIRTVIILIVTAVLITMRGEWQPLERIAGRSLVFLCLSGLATGLSWLCYFRALQLGPASSVAPVDKLSVVIVIVLGCILFGEALTFKLMIGGALIVAGAVILALP